MTTKTIELTCPCDEPGSLTLEVLEPCAALCPDGVIRPARLVDPPHDADSAIDFAGNPGASAYVVHESGVRVTGRVKYGTRGEWHFVPFTWDVEGHLVSRWHEKTAHHCVLVAAVA